MVIFNEFRAERRNVRSPTAVFSSSKNLRAPGGWSKRKINPNDAMDSYFLLLTLSCFCLGSSGFLRFVAKMSYTRKDLPQSSVVLLNPFSTICDWVVRMTKNEGNL